MLTEQQKEIAERKLCELNGWAINAPYLYTAREMIAQRHSPLKESWAVNIRQAIAYAVAQKEE